MLSNTVENYEERDQENIIQSCFHQQCSMFYIKMYSGVYDIKLLLGVKTTLGWLKILSNHSGNQTYDLRNADSSILKVVGSIPIEVGQNFQPA